MMKKWDGIRENCEDFRKITYKDCLIDWAERWGDKVAISCDGETITYKELDEKSDNLMAYFYRLGLRKGDIVIFQVPNSIEWTVTLFALLRGGIIPVMMLPAHGKYEISGICSIAKPRACITMDTIFHADCEETAKLVASEESSIEFLLNGDDIRSAMEMDNTDTVYDAPAYTDIAMLLLSGGTTGIPKMIPRTHGDYIYDNTVIGKRCELDESSVFLAALPAAHNFTLGNPGVLGTLMYGGRVVITDSASPMEIFDLIEEERVTYTAMVPAVLGLCIKYREDDDDADISSLRFVMTGGAMLPADIEQKADKVLGCTLLQIYGTAEGLNTCYAPSYRTGPDSGKQGRPISPYDEILILDSDGKPLPTGSEGEMVTRGPYTITGYFRNDKANAESFTADGYYKTGDLAILNERGELTITGRAVEQINKCGEKIMPAELENCLRTHKLISDCVVAGLPDKEMGNLVGMFIKNDGVKLTLSDIHCFLREKDIAAYKWPDRLYYVDSFPLTAVNKVDKKKLVAEAAEVNI